MTDRTIFRTVKDKDNPYVMVDKRPLENPRLSWRAKGILTYLLSRPDNWVVRLRDLANRSTDGVYAIRSAIKELTAVGHITRREEREDGKFKQYVLEVHEVITCPPSNLPQAVSSQAVNLTRTNNESLASNDSSKQPISEKSAKIPSDVSGRSAKREVSEETKRALAGWAPVESALHGLPVSEADLARERNASAATVEFERALMVRIPWGKESKFMAWVAEQYAKDSTCFVRYAKWQKDDPYKSLSAKQIRGKPELLMDTWPAFEGMNAPKRLADGPDPELERLRREAEIVWPKPPERKAK